MTCLDFRRLALTLTACAAVAALPAAARADQFAYVADQGDGTVTPVDLSTGSGEPPITIGGSPDAVAITPDASTMLVADSSSASITPITIQTSGASLSYTPITPIPVGSDPDAVAITPDGMTAYVANYGSGSVTPVTLATDTPGAPISVGSEPDAIAITPNGEIAFVANNEGTVTPIVTATDLTDSKVRVGANPDAIAISPDGNVAYVTSATGGEISRFSIPSWSLESPLNVGSTPDAIAVSPDSSTLWVANNIAAVNATPQYALTPVSLSPDSVGTLGTPIELPGQPSALAISADGSTAYVTIYASDEVLPVSLPDGPVGTPIAVGSEPAGFTLTPLDTAASGPGSAPYVFPVTGSQTGTTGNQQVSLSIGATTTSPTATCLAPGASITSKLTAKQAKTGAKLKFASATFKLGKHSKTVRKLPAKVSLSLRGLAPGRQTVTVTVNYTRRVFVPATRRSRARFATRKSKLTLRTRFTIC